MKIEPKRRYAPESAGAQKGLVLFVALIVLVAMTLAAIALTRSVETTTLVAGNLAFKQSATNAADVATEKVIEWIAAHATDGSLEQDQSASGYYATSLDLVDYTGSGKDAAKTARIDWDANNCAGASPSACLTPASLATDAGGNTVKYVASRLCLTPGSVNAASNSCVMYSGTMDSPARGRVDYSTKRFTAPSSPYYRIVTRVVGPRNVTSYVETVVHF